MLKSLSINLSLIQVLLEMLGYSKFVNELVTNKRVLDFETIEFSNNFSMIHDK